MYLMYKIDKHETERTLQKVFHSYNKLAKRMGYSHWDQSTTSVHPTSKDDMQEKRVEDEFTAEVLVDHEVEFDHKNGYRYLLCTGFMLSILTVYGIICLPFVPCIQRRVIKGQKCKITDRQVELETNGLVHTSKNIPLDKIQDVAINQGCIQSCFNVKSLDIQTAGNSNGRPECSLIAPKDADFVRDEIMDRRDRLVHGSTSLSKRSLKIQSTPHTITSKPLTSSMNSEDASSIVVELKALNEKVERIEQQIELGLYKVGK